MAIPPNAKKFEQPMDPSDVVDYKANLSGEDGLLEDGEKIATFTLTVLAEGVARGLTIGTGIRAPSKIEGAPGAGIDTGVQMWFSVDGGHTSDPEFSGTGVDLPVELTVVTDSSPSRTRQRTLVVGVAQQ